MKSDEIDLMSASCFSCFQPSYLHAIVNHPYIQLSDLNRIIFKTRYLVFLLVTERRRNSMKVWYYGLRAFIHTGTLVTPAILSWQLFSTVNINGTIVAWAVWAMTILVSVFTGFITIYDLDRKYILYDISTELLHKEIWRFLQLSGHYQNPDRVVTHDEVFILFCNNMEEIIKKIRSKEHTYLEKNVERAGMGHRSVEAIDMNAHSGHNNANRARESIDMETMPIMQDFDGRNARDSKERRESRDVVSMEDIRGASQAGWNNMRDQRDARGASQAGRRSSACIMADDPRFSFVMPAEKLDR